MLRRRCLTGRRRAPAASARPRVKIEKPYDGHGLCVAKLVKEVTLESTLYPGQQRKAWEVKYESDGLVEHFEETCLVYCS